MNCGSVLVHDIFYFGQDESDNNKRNAEPKLFNVGLSKCDRETNFASSMLNYHSTIIVC